MIFRLASAVLLALVCATSHAQKPIPCAYAVGAVCDVTGPVSGTLTKTGSMAFDVSAAAPAGTAPGVIASVFIPTTMGQPETFRCAPLKADQRIVCRGTTVGDALHGGLVTVRVPVTGRGGTDLIGTISWR